MPPGHQPSDYTCDERKPSTKAAQSAPLNEIVLNLHMHTAYSDGTGSHRDIAEAAVRSGLDAVLVTDHNVWVQGVDRYCETAAGRVLVLAGEEIHDRARDPQKNHLLVFGAGRELAQYAGDTAALLHTVRRLGGLAFLAHPADPPAPAFHEPDISWEDWSVDDFVGMELWNGFSELKRHLATRLHGLFLALFPELVAHGPFSRAIERWDRMLATRQVVAIGGSDAHALDKRMGPLRRIIFPYDFHFRAVNTHLLLDGPLSGDAARDASRIYAAMAAGRCFIAYDLPRPARGFRFWAQTAERQVPMGSSTPADSDVMLHADTPHSCEILLLKDGVPIHRVATGRELTHPSRGSGVYRIEAYRRFRARRRTWILSNPIYLA